MAAMFKDNYNEDKADSILEQLIENSDQLVNYSGEVFYFLKFHYDGILLKRVLKINPQKEVFVCKWLIQNVKILS